MGQSVCSECGAPATEYWTPSVGDEVWLNYPDASDSEGVVVGFVPEDAGHRAGQPIIERQRDEPDRGGMFSIPGKKKGERVVIHPMFLLPFRFGGPEYKQAVTEGRVC